MTSQTKWPICLWYQTTMPYCLIKSPDEILTNYVSTGECDYPLVTSIDTSRGMKWIWSFKCMNRPNARYNIYHMDFWISILGGKYLCWRQTNWKLVDTNFNLSGEGNLRPTSPGPKSDTENECKYFNPLCQGRRNVTIYLIG